MNLGRRIMIMGSPGSGKSTIAMRLGSLTGLPVIHLDRLFWNPGWVSTPGDIMDEKVHNAVSRNEWIIDGNYTRTLNIRLDKADTIVYLDFNRFVCLFRAYKRWLKNFGRTRYDLGEGCPEKMDAEFVKWIWGYPRRSRGEALETLSKARQQVFHLKGNSAVRRFLNEVRISCANNQ